MDFQERDFLVLGWGWKNSFYEWVASEKLGLEVDVQSTFDRAKKNAPEDRTDMQAQLIEWAYEFRTLRLAQKDMALAA